ncbi:STAS domain-containing protein [Amycolatopsis sp. 195334CR]|uniref:STAS domain-containing protein n=1 Tax=Amycolatopsis sp. 195334CR TaxID=2814588 RepID=UPI001A8D9A6A|nr:STAS domain-containing protein [Amycolatopsis sp. 195334CR]MBN6041731.1 STAS domain-containing protein [Amycolatopsis sp. 195334CR]
MTEFSYDVALDDDRVVVTTAGALDAHTGAEFQVALRELAERHPELVLDLAGLTYVDSTGLSAFIAAHKRASARGGRVRLSGVPPFLARLLAVTGLNTILPVLR